MSYIHHISWVLPAIDDLKKATHLRPLKPKYFDQLIPRG